MHSVLSRAINCPRNNAIYPKTNPIPNPGGMNPKKASIAFIKCIGRSSDLLQF